MRAEDRTRRVYYRHCHGRVYYIGEDTSSRIINARPGLAIHLILPLWKPDEGSNELQGLVVATFSTSSQIEREPDRHASPTSAEINEQQPHSMGEMMRRTGGSSWWIHHGICQDRATTRDKTRVTGHTGRSPCGPFQDAPNA
ncbi:hypothetical protein R1flu_026631 [Riccia fluitans]|uniref:Uncharacterized protein n=1 Tax=Riccia fluitans TaxID=41844 RepID=A0ABD1XH81_9MARC